MLSKPSNGLFMDELNILEKASLDINNVNYEGNLLYDSYKQLLLEYKKLLRISKKVFKISDSQGKELKRRENEIRNILDNSNQGFLTFGKSLLINKEYSSECMRIFGKRISGSNIVELLSGEIAEQKELFQSVFTDIFNNNSYEARLEQLSRLPNMLKINESYINVKYKVIHSDEALWGSETIMLILTDITEKKRTEDQVIYLSYHDKLTSLYNRAYIESIASQLQTENNMPLSVIMADMNGLKLTNDVFGHESGDKLLINASNVFVKCCRRSDIVARWGGDEFLIILPGAGSSMCRKVCDRIKETCRNSKNDPIELSVSLGTATMESPSTNISELFNIAENIMYTNKLTESKNVRRKIILSLEQTLHEKCYEDTGHVGRVKETSLKFAECLNLNEDSIDMINLPLAAALHDIGKVSIPREILGKEGKLSETEWDIMKSHTEIGFRMAQSIEEPVLAQAILSMREKWDGTGYPYGLRETQIPTVARIVCIAEAFDVMTHDRPYRKALSKEEAIGELIRCKGKQFDPKLTENFIENIDKILAS